MHPASILRRVVEGRNHFQKSPRVEPARKLTDTFFSHQTSITLDAPSLSRIVNKAKREGDWLASGLSPLIFLVAVDFLRGVA